MSVYVGEEFRFTHKGAEFVGNIHADDSNPAPWEEYDGNCPVRRVASNYGTQYGESKRSGEYVFHRGNRRGYSYVVDIPECMAIAMRDGWGPAVPGNTPRQNARAAVLANIEYLRGWCADDWQYVGVVVTPICKCCGTPQKEKSQSVWGVESCGDYAREECARELAEECEA